MRARANIWVIHYLYCDIRSPHFLLTPLLLLSTLTSSPLPHFTLSLPSHPTHYASATSHFGMIDDHDALLLGSLLTS